jgi:hypothetical protein
MKAFMFTLAIVLVLGIVLFVVSRIRSGSPDGARTAQGLEPHIARRPATNVVQVIARGDPNVVARRAFGLVMRVYFRLPGVPRMGAGLPAPRARWPLAGMPPKEQWVGSYAMPVPESIRELPRDVDADGLHAELARWEYGEVAEILHVGPYDTEAPTIERLQQFIARSHYVVAGDHEEEYVKGPGMLGLGNPRDYRTIIRYAVRPESAMARAPQEPAATVSR